MAHSCTIKGCKWYTIEPNRHYSGCLASWHVYEEHPDVWRGLFGDRPPNDPDPRDPEQRLFMNLSEGSN
jgi:hypothetical protein